MRRAASFLLAGGRRSRRAALLALAALTMAGLTASAVVLAKTIEGGPGHDRLIGTRHTDRIDGRAGNDVIAGRGGSDNLRGSGGDDRIKGGGGRDEFDMHHGEEVGGLGDDVIHARDGRRDEINCGPGKDRAVVDRAEDGVFNCERVVEPTPGSKRG